LLEPSKALPKVEKSPVKSSKLKNGGEQFSPRTLLNFMNIINMPESQLLEDACRAFLHVV
jgi:hypothetical protein